MWQKTTQLQLGFWVILYCKDRTWQFQTIITLIPLPWTGKHHKTDPMIGLFQTPPPPNRWEEFFTPLPPGFLGPLDPFLLPVFPLFFISSEINLRAKENTYNTLYYNTILWLQLQYFVIFRPLANITRKLSVKVKYDTTAKTLPSMGFTWTHDLQYHCSALWLSTQLSSQLGAGHLEFASS